MNTSFISVEKIRALDPGALASVTAVTALAAFLILPFISGFSFFDALPVLALPFIVVGAVELVVDRHYAICIAAALLCILFYFVDPLMSVVASFVIVCPVGITALCGSVQRFGFVRTLLLVEGSYSHSKRSLPGRLAYFMFNIPEGLDVRDIAVEDRAVRHSLSFRDVFDVVIMALPFVALAWIAMALLPGFSSATLVTFLCSFTVMLYIVAAVLSPVILRSLKVGIRQGNGGRFMLYDGLLGTMKRASVPLIIALVLVAALTVCDAGTFLNILASLAACAVVAVVSSLFYFIAVEPVISPELSKAWSSLRPVKIYAGLDTRNIHSLKDGVPGTPMRDPKACFSDQKN